MSSLHHPRRRGVLPVVIAGGAVVALSIWALRPLPRIDVGEPEPARAVPEQPAPPQLALDLAAFRAPLWVAPPPPPPPAPTIAAAPPPPLKLQLVAVLREPEGYRAVLYDPDADKLIFASEGQALGTRTIETVTRSDVKIRTGQALQTLSLLDKGASP
jgi:hypothetical protein